MLWNQHLLPHARHQPQHQPHSLIPSAQMINLEKAMNFRSQQIISYCRGTQNQGLREVDLEPSPDRSSDMINTLKQERNIKESKLYCRTCTHTWIPAFREIDLEHRAKTGTNRTRPLVSLYWLFQSLKLLSEWDLQPNLTQIKQGRTYQIVLNVKKVWPNPQILCSSAYPNKLSHKSFTSQLMPTNGVIGGAVTSKEKTKSNFLARQRPYQNLR